MYSYVQSRGRSTSRRPPLAAYTCALLLLTLASPCTSELVAPEARVTVDAKASIAQLRVHVHIRNDGDTPVSTLPVTVPRGASGVACAVGDAVTKSSDLLRLEVGTSPDATVDVLSAALPSPLAPGEEVEISTTAVLPAAMVADPAEITEGQTQYVKLALDALFVRPYRVLRASGVLNLAAPAVQGALHAPEPFESKDFVVKLGPYADVAPYGAVGDVSVRFKHDRALLVAREAVREMRVSHWGNVAVREEFRVENTAARHTGRWSRVDYTSHSSRRGNTMVADVWANLPRRASNVEYKDLVGNITTSRLRKPNKWYTPFNAEFRFPLLGGWKNHFWYTYDVPLGFFMLSKGSSHRLRVPVFPSIEGMFLCDLLRVRVLLPEGASNVNIVPHASLDLEVKESIEKTTLNYFGRRVVTLEGRSVYTDASVHKAIVTISYDFAAASLFVTPLIVTAGIFAFFLALIVLSRTDMTLVPDAMDPSQQSVLRESELLQNVVGLIRTFDQAFAHLDDTFATINAESARHMSAKTQDLEKTMKEQEAAIVAVSLDLKSLGSAKYEIVSAIAQRLSSKRQTSMKVFSSRVLLFEGLMNQEGYESQVWDKLANSLFAVSAEIYSLEEALTEEM